MSHFERGPRDGGQSDPSTRRSLRKLQDDPVRLASLLAGANSVVPRRRRRFGFLTASGATILLLLSALEAPDLFAAVGLTGDQHIAADRMSERAHANPKGDTGRVTQPWTTTTTTPGTTTPGTTTPTRAAAPSKAPVTTPPPTLARTAQPSITLARVAPRGSQTPTPTPTPTSTPTAHGKGKGHGKSGSGTPPNGH